jgi:hypothetical protein
MAKRILKKMLETDAMIQTLLDAAVLRGQMKLRLRVSCFDIAVLIEEVCADIRLSGKEARIECKNIEGYWCRTSMKRVLENWFPMHKNMAINQKAMAVSAH